MTTEKVVITLKSTDPKVVQDPAVTAWLDYAGKLLTEELNRELSKPIYLILR